MNLLDRYQRLSIWNKFAFWGSVASLVGLGWEGFAYFQPPLGEPVLEISYRAPTEIFIRNVGIVAAKNVQFYPVLYSITREGRIHDRFIPDKPSLHLDELDSGEEVEISRSSYLRIEDFSKIEYPPKGFQGPFLVPTVTYQGASQKHLIFDVYDFFGPNEALLLLAPLSYAPGVTMKGDFGKLDQTLASIKQDITLAFHE